MTEMPLTISLPNCPQVLGRSLRKASNAVEAPVLTELLLFREALRVLEGNDSAIVEAEIQSQEVAAEAAVAAESVDTLKRKSHAQVSC